MLPERFPLAMESRSLNANSCKAPHLLGPPPRTRLSRSAALCMALSLGISTPIWALSTVTLPERACWSLGLEIQHQDGFENTPPALPASPSFGFGGDFPGDQRRTVFVQSLGVTRAYHVHLPPNYTPDQAWPLVMVLHGQPPGPSYSELYAQFTMTHWSELADARGFVVLAPVASGPTSGSWNPPDDGAMIDAVLADVESAYNVNRMRRYLWGFSSGGHYGHGFALSHSATLAAYGVNAGVLEGYAGPTAPVMATRKLPVSIRVGTFDSPGMLAAARRDPPRFTANGWVAGDTLKYTEFVGGHEYTGADLEAQWNFLCRFAVSP